jgi:hypothetical protein
MSLARDSDTVSTGTFRMRTEGAGEMEMQVKMGLQRPVDMATWGEDIESAPLQSVQMTLNDLGFVPKRNAYCARKHGLTAEAFIDYHMREVARYAGEHGTAIGQGTLAQYRDFAQNGGTLTLRTAGTRQIPMMAFVEMDRMQKMRAYPVMISANGKSPANFSYGFDPNATQPAVQPAAGAAGAVAIPVANVAPAVAANGATSAMPEPGAVVPYAHLQHLVGQHVDIATTYGSVRKGVVTLVGPITASLQLDKEEGGLLLTMPANSITEIRYTPISNTTNTPVAHAPAANQATQKAP